MPQGTRTDREPSANLQKVTRPGAAALPHVSGRSMRSVKPGRAGPGERHAGAGAARGKRRGGCLGRGRGRSKASRRRRSGPQAWPRLDPSPPGAPIIHVSTWRRLADHHHHLAASMPPTDRGGGVVPPARAARPAAMGRRKPRRDPPARFVGGDRNSSVSPPPRATNFWEKFCADPLRVGNRQQRQTLDGRTGRVSLTRPTPHQPHGRSQWNTPAYPGAVLRAA
jgi:hypothetical protein